MSIIRGSKVILLKDGKIIFEGKVVRIKEVKNDRRN